ncbi:hypothetical protein [Streptomyces sp. NPDC058398]|uniref:hypothetical protein n=1 Tax=Streptomyces sp. NPDC058398 TaxID=3346479 RepID=UPI003664D453
MWQLGAEARPDESVTAPHDALRALSGPLHDVAVREMGENGATVDDLVRLTGYDPEKYRRWGPAAGLERGRPPTRGAGASD